MATAQNKDVPAVRLREPDRSQVRMIVQSPDDLIAQDHQTRVIWRVCQAQDRSAFCRPIKAREGVCGRDATGPTRMIATLVQKKLVEAHRISRDGTRVRACAGASSFRREARLRQLLEGAQKHVRELRARLDDPERSAGLSAKQKAARTRAARERERRIERAIERLPELKKRQEKLAGRKSKKEKERLKEPRASTTDADATVMKVANGGFNPAVNVRFATDTGSRVITGVEVSAEGNDHHLAEPMRRPVEQRTGRTVHEHLMDGGYPVLEEIQTAAGQGVTVYVPPKPPQGSAAGRRGVHAQGGGKPGAPGDWRERMGSEGGRAIYKERAATSETVNADPRTHRGMDRMLVRGLKKVKCVALWRAMAYNIPHCAAALTA